MCAGEQKIKEGDNVRFAGWGVEAGESEQRGPVWELDWFQRRLPASFMSPTSRLLSINTTR